MNIHELAKHFEYIYPELKIIINSYEAQKHLISIGIYDSNYIGFYQNKYVAHKFNIKAETDLIFIQDDLNFNNAFRTLFHELGHFLGFKLRRPNSMILSACAIQEYGSHYNKYYNCEEYIADSISFKLMEYYKLTTEEVKFSHLAYISQHYVNLEVRKIVNVDLEIEKGVSEIVKIIDSFKLKQIA